MRAFEVAQRLNVSPYSESPSEWTPLQWDLWAEFLWQKAEEADRKQRSSQLTMRPDDYE